MKHTFGSVKIIHPYDGPLLSGDENEQVRFISRTRFGTNAPDKKILPVVFAYKCQVCIDDVHIASIMTDYMYQLGFDLSEEPSAELSKLIKNVSVKFFREFFLHAYKIHLDVEKVLFEIINPGTLKQSVDQIIAEAKSRNLI